jgi:hypothetical protein
MIGSGRARRRVTDTAMVTDRDRAIVEWIGRLGAAGATDAMARFSMGRSQAYARLRTLVDAALVEPRRLLCGHPALFVATREGLVWARLARFEPCHVGVASATHWALCARLAVALERAEPNFVMWSERDVRVAELDAGHAVASAEVGRLSDGRPRLRRADLILMARDERGRPIAVEVELAVKGARRLEAICRAWARCRLIESVRYYAAPAAARAVARAVDRVHAHDVIEIHSLRKTLKEADDVRRAVA